MMTFEQFLYMKLAEEASEVSQDAIKTMQFGPEERCVDLVDNNKERVNKEVKDMLVILSWINPNTDYTHLIDKAHYDAKMIKLRHYYLYSVSLGLVEVLPDGHNFLFYGLLSDPTKP